MGGGTGGGPGSPDDFRYTGGLVGFPGVISAGLAPSGTWKTRGGSEPPQPRVWLDAMAAVVSTRTPRQDGLRDLMVEIYRVGGRNSDNEPGSITMCKRRTWLGLVPSSV